MQEAPPSRSHPKNGWGLSWFFFQTVCPCELGAVPYGLVESTAADRAAADMRRGGHVGECEGGRFFARSASLALPPEERLGIELVFLSDGMPLRVGRGFL